jgi:hypothetical protein
VDFQFLIEEYARSGVGENLYRHILVAVRRVIFGHGYPTSYSPTGRWDEDALTGLAHDWTMQKLLRYGQLEHLLLTNHTMRGLEKGLELSFRHFLIGQRARSVLVNLFRRMAVILDRTPSFRLCVDTGRKATRLWGLSSWLAVRVFDASDTELIAAGYRVPDLPIMRYRSDAQKLSPVLSDNDLVRFLELLLAEVESCLSLEQILVVVRYRFHLLDATEVSLEETLTGGDTEDSLRLIDTIGSGSPPDEEVLAAETAETVLRALGPRQRQVLRFFIQPDATLVRVAEQVGISKSTVHNDVRRISALIQRHAGGPDEARAVYDRLVEMLE